METASELKEKELSEREEENKTKGNKRKGRKKQLLNNRLKLCLTVQWQFHEPGVLFRRGFSLQEFADQCFGNKAGYGKGHQMPIHYGSKRHNFSTISSPIA
ncbi:hypothetical protein V6N12_036171 [Hibiscus sabdariffa]|uniref:Uncharacterized protein n=1 Tax=Hibiscus sabdariffa TaxID=183260 RepID=A0ABR2EPV9_9ROSI